MAFSAATAAIGAALLWASAAEAQTYDVPITLPASVDFSDVVLGATNNLRIETFANVEGGSHSRIVNMGTGTTGVSFGAKSGDVWSVATTTVEVARITGNVTCEGLVVTVPGSTITGTVKQLTSIGRTSGPVLHVEFPTTSAGSINVLPLATQTLSPGRYTNLNVSPGGTLSLRSGLYYFDAYVVDPLSTVVVDESAGPVEIYVKTTIQHMGTYRKSTGGAPNLFVGFFGIVPAYVGTPFPGTVIAPNAQLVIGTTAGNTTHLGAFFGQGIEVLPFTTIKHRATDHFGIGDGNDIAPTAISTPIVPIPDPSSAPSFTGTLDPTHTYYTSLHPKAADPAHGVVAPKYCDANENPVPGPTDAQLNSAPPAGSTCPAVAPNTTNCPVDPNSLTTACTSDSDCTGGAICAAHCVDSGCSNIEHRCGKPAASCAGLPAEANCDEIRMCARPGAVGTATADDVAAQIPPTTAPGPNATIPASQVDELGPIESVAQALCDTSSPPTVTTKDASDKPANEGSKEWGVYFDPISDFGITPVKRPDGIAELQDLHATGGVAFGGIIFKNKVEVLSTQLKATLDDCGVTLNGTLKLFGEAIAVWTPRAREQGHLAFKDKDSIATPALANQECQGAREATKQAITDARKANLFAREVAQYYQTNRMTPELCFEIQREVPNPEKDPNTGRPYDCFDIATIPIGAQINILNAWKAEYDGKTKAYTDFAAQLQLKRQAISVSSTVDIFTTPPHAFHLKVLDQDFPIGPVTLNLAVEGYGSWNVSGGIQFGIGVDGNFQKATDILTNGLKGELPRIGDIRAYGGPVITPSGTLGVQAYAGVGIPGVSIGIEGKVSLLTIGVPTGIVAAVMRVSGPDPRSATGTEFDGAPKPGMIASDYRWVTGFDWNSKLTLSALDGQMDLAARVHLLFFSHTFRLKLFGWKGFSKDFVLVGGGTGDSVKYSADYGKQGDSIFYTEIPFISDNPPKTAPMGPEPATCAPVVI